MISATTFIKGPGGDNFSALEQSCCPWQLPAVLAFTAHSSQLPAHCPSPSLGLLGRAGAPQARGPTCHAEGPAEPAGVLLAVLQLHVPHPHDLAHQADPGPDQVRTAQVLKEISNQVPSMSFLSGKEDTGREGFCWVIHR